MELNYRDKRLILYSIVSIIMVTFIIAGVFTLIRVDVPELIWLFALMTVSTNVLQPLLSSKHKLSSSGSKPREQTSTQEAQQQIDLLSMEFSNRDKNLLLICTIAIIFISIGVVTISILLRFNYSQLIWFIMFTFISTFIMQSLLRKKPYNVLRTTINSLSTTTNQKELNTIQKEQKQIEDSILEKLNQMNKGKNNDKAQIMVEDQGKKQDLHIFFTIQKGLEHLTEIYKIGEGQAIAIFRVSLFLMFIGIFIIALGIYIIIFIDKSLNFQSTITTIGGVVVEFLSGTCLIIYNRSQDQLSNSFNQLVKMQDTMLAVQLSMETPDQGKKIEFLEKIIDGLVERSSQAVVNKASTMNKRKNHIKSHTQGTSDQTHEQTQQ